MHDTVPTVNIKAPKEATKGQGLDLPSGMQLF
jgi:hypothetical protein